MRIGIIGSGRIGGTAAQLFEGAGHDVVVGSRSNGKVDAAADHGQVVLAAIPFQAYHDLPADRLAGKIVIDAMNYYPAPGGEIDEIAAGTPSSVLVARALPESTVVKALNTMRSDQLGSRGRPAADPERLTMFVAADDDDAERTVVELIDEIGFDSVATGSLANSGVQQPGAPVYNNPMSAAEARERLATRP
jgi:predicted dinucleotide-binding enzyme